MKKLVASLLLGMGLALGGLNVSAQTTTEAPAAVTAPAETPLHLRRGTRCRSTCHGR